MAKPNIQVAAAIISENQRLLLARRKDGTFAGYWEFPGGKVEPGETPEQALQREIREELSTESEVQDYYGEAEHKVASGDVLTILFYRCRLVGAPMAGEAHDQVEWVPFAEALKYRLIPADIPIVRRFLEESDAI